MQTADYRLMAERLEGITLELENLYPEGQIKQYSRLSLPKEKQKNFKWERVVDGDNEFYEWEA